MNEYQKINDCILNITEEAKNASIQRYLDRFKGSPRFDKLVPDRKPIKFAKTTPPGRRQCVIGTHSAVN